MLNEKWLNLQLFAGDGAGEGGGEGAATGENATAAAEQKLRELGVPEDKIRKRASKVASNMPTQSAKTDTVEQKTEETKGQTAPAETPTEGTQGTPARMSWDEIMKDPEYNKQMQAVVKSRLKSEKSADENLTKLAPTLELLARKYKLDPTNIDYDALNKAVTDDDGYYEDKALEMGVSVETARKIDMQERNQAREQKTLQDQAIEQHLTNLEMQGEELRKIFPNFDLRVELQNPAFARMTAPGKGIMSVEDAYRAVHRNEIESASMQIVAKKTTEKISNSIQAGSRRPDESGTSSQGPSSVRFDYSKASREQREAFKRELRAKLARGEKVYPGQQ